MDAERRQITVLFTDMVDFTSFSERAGEESAFTLMQAIARLMEDTVREQGGSVRGFTGDGIMAIFGAPVAFEDASLRACRAALLINERLIEATGALETKFGVRPRMRIGINTGLAVVGQIQAGADANVTVMGDTVNLASRLQTLAAPGTIFLSEETQRLVQGLVETSFTGTHSIKGKAEPLRVYRLDAIRHGATRFDEAVRRGLSPFVGRERELEVLERGLGEARNHLHVMSWPSRASASPACCTSSANASARSAPLSCREAVRPTASKHPSFPSSTWCAARFALAPASGKRTLRKNWKWG